MSVFDNREIRLRLREAFPKFFVNSSWEIIIYPARNSYFMLEGLETELDLKCKILEWLSREAGKSVSRQSQKYHAEGINKFLGTDFSKEDFDQIYTYLGNRCNHEKTVRFIESGYDMSVLAHTTPDGWQSPHTTTHPKNCAECRADGIARACRCGGRECEHLKERLK